MFVINLQHSLDREGVGAKAANLARTMEMGQSVPPGCVITRQALSRFLEQTGLLPRAQRLIDDNGLDDTARATEHDALCEEVLKAPIPKPVIEAVTPIVRALLDDAPHGLAVRSSGVHEDSAKASFAGVYESFLGIRSETDLWLAVRRCWCASWAPHAIDYARRMGIQPAVDGMGVLLQHLARADSAGVLFTADPLTGNPWRFVLESSFGLARDLVASTGAMPVDRFLFEWDTGEILGRDIAPKKTALIPGASGIDSIDIPPDRQSAPSLEDDLARWIAQVGLQIDRAFDARVDVEWVVEGDDIHIVQVRPITALPAFFPHHLPAYLADRTWRPAKKWHFPLSRLRKVDGTVTLPIYRDKLITEKYSRDLEVGPIETPVHLKCGAEMDFHGYRYLVEGKVDWPQISASQLEQYLVEYEPRFRSDFLYSNNTKFPSIEKRAKRLENEVKTLEQAIDAILWAQEEMWGLGAGLGPTQYLCFKCRSLLSAFVDEHLPNVDVNDLTLGHHPELNPYWPHLLMADTEEMATLLGPERERFEGLSLDELIRTLLVKEAPSPFIVALEECCDRLCLVPPWQFQFPDEITHDPTMDILRLIRKALRGGPRIAQIAEEASRRREAVVAEVRETLASRPAELMRFERFYDRTLFWGPALNHRVLRVNVPERKLRRLFLKMREVLLAAGLVDVVDDVLFFTVEDLKVIAVTGDIAAGRRLLQKRRLEYERSARLVAPAFLGKPPEEESTTKPPAAPDANKAGAEAGTVIAGKPAGPGSSQGVVRRIETLEEGDDVGREEDVVVLVKPIQSTNWHVPLLFSMLLRVRGLVVPDAPGMWMNHISQIARECRVPIVQVTPSDLERLVEGHRVEVDGTRGIVTLVDA